MLRTVENERLIFDPYNPLKWGLLHRSTIVIMIPLPTYNVKWQFLQREKMSERTSLTCKDAAIQKVHRGATPGTINLNLPNLSQKDAKWVGCL